MSWKDALLGYRPGRELVAGEPIIQSAMAKLLDAPAVESTIEPLCRMAYVPPFDERLVLTPNYLVYKTDFEVIRTLKTAFTTGADKLGPFWAGPMMKTLMSCVDTDDQSFWLPRHAIASIDTYAIEGTSQVLGLFSQQVTVYCYDVHLDGGTLTFLQAGTGQKNAEKQFRAMLDPLAERDAGRRSA